VDVIVGEGNLVRVPGLIGGSEEAATKSLERAGLRPGRVISEESARAAGEVLRQHPPQGSLAPRGSGVDFWLAGSRMVVVPSVVGKMAGAGMAELEHLRLSGEPLGEEESPRPEGEILRQDPPPGARVPPGTRVELWVASSTLVAVPDLSGIQGRRAAERLRAAGLTAGQVETQASPAPHGSVVRQSPPAGVRVQRGTRVDYWVAASESVVVPALVGMDMVSAQTRLAARGLRLEPQPPETNAAPDGKIIAQLPAEGTRVPPGTAVVVRISAGLGPLRPWFLGAGIAALLAGVGWWWGRRPKPDTTQAPSPQPKVRVRLGEPDVRAPHTLPFDPKAPDVGIRVCVVRLNTEVTAEQLIVREERRRT
jgi:beta-lactam-binding protein with PASTA domain